MTRDDIGLAQGLLLDGFSRTAEALPNLLAELSPAELLWQPDPAANSIAWLVWHLTRVQDDHVAGVGRIEQVWTSDGWADRFDLPYARRSIGFGQGCPPLCGKHDATFVRPQTSLGCARQTSCLGEPLLYAHTCELAPRTQSWARAGVQARPRRPVSGLRDA